MLWEIHLVSTALGSEFCDVTEIFNTDMRYRKTLQVDAFAMMNCTQVFNFMQMC